MSDIRDLGGPGRAAFDTAQKLQRANLIDDAQFRELTNDNVGPQDIQIANQALDKIQASTPDAMNLLRSIPGLNNNILDLQRQALQKTVAEPNAARSTSETPGQNPLTRFLESVGISPRAMADFGARMHEMQRTAIEHIR